MQDGRVRMRKGGMHQRERKGGMQDGRVRMRKGGMHQRESGRGRGACRTGELG